MDSYRAYCHSTNTARVRIVWLLLSELVYHHEYCIVHSGNCARLVREHGNGIPKVGPMLFRKVQQRFGC